MLERFVKTVWYTALLFKIGGPRIFFQQLRRQIYGKDVLLGLQRILDATCAEVPSRLEYSLRPASDEDMEEVLSAARSESKDSVHELIKRMWFYECGFH